MRSSLAKIIFFAFILISLVSCTTVVYTGRPGPRHAAWVNGHWGPHGHWVPGHWSSR